MKTIHQFFLPLFVVIGFNAAAQQKAANMQYTVSMENAAAHLYHVELTNHTPGKTLDFKMCAWTPGYYQILDFAGAVQDFKVTDNKGGVLNWEKP
jgi:predicted metalloprotease with PDZ domain